MEISVAVPNVTQAQGLVQRLSAALDATVTFDVRLKEIRVLSGMESHRVVLRVVNTVEDWLEQETVDSAKLSLGDRSCTLFGPGRIATPR